MQVNLDKFHALKVFKNFIIDFHYVKPFYCVNDNEEMDEKTPQNMHCMFC
jgi:hypothetical protein